MPPVVSPGVPVLDVPSIEPAVPPTGSVGPVVPLPIVGSVVVDPVVSVVVIPPLRPFRPRRDDRLCVVGVEDVVGSVGDVVVWSLIDPGLPAVPLDPVLPLVVV